MLLTALLPVFWLIGRRTAPATKQEPLLFRAELKPATLQESARGIAATSGPVRLPALAGGETAYRLLFLPGGSEGNGQPPYRLRIEAPDARDIWQGVWNAAGSDRGPAELVLPSEGLRPGRYALFVEDAAGMMRSFPFTVP